MHITPRFFVMACTKTTSEFMQAQFMLRSEYLEINFELKNCLCLSLSTFQENFFS